MDQVDAAPGTKGSQEGSVQLPATEGGEMPATKNGEMPASEGGASALPAEVKESKEAHGVHPFDAAFAEMMNTARGRVEVPSFEDLAALVKELPVPFASAASRQCHLVRRGAGKLSTWHTGMSVDGTGVHVTFRMIVQCVPSPEFFPACAYDSPLYEGAAMVHDGKRVPLASLYKRDDEAGVEDRAARRERTFFYAITYGRVSTDKTVYYLDDAALRAALPGVFEFATKWLGDQEVATNHIGSCGPRVGMCLNFAVRASPQAFVHLAVHFTMDDAGIDVQ
jgi:hypothetical protein